MASVTGAVAVSSQARLSYLALFSIRNTLILSSQRRSSSSSSTYHHSDFTGGPWTGSYEPGQPTPGPLGGASIYGVPRLTPKALKRHLDNFVVGQDRAKRVLSVAVYNHYQRVQELQRQQEEFEALTQQKARRDMAERQAERHPIEDDFPGQQSTTYVHKPSAPMPEPPSDLYGHIVDNSPLTLEKSNILLLGPSGVGKTLMARTLARVLEVPFSMSDCTPFTQAGYIGEDADICVHRLLSAANYDVARAERGIICLDEVDKIATAKVSHGKDVSGEGVQQALLKIIEGTTLQINTKQERGSSGRNSNGSNYPANGSGGSSGGSASGGSGGPAKGETFNVRTDNILFIFTGAFIGLPKMIMDRISKGSIGFGQPVRASSASDQTSMKGEDELFRKFLPFFTTNEDSDKSERNPLDLVEPGDLQKFGLIPELVGRVPVTTALSALDEEALVRVLTEPRNCLIRQYEQLFQMSGVELRFTSSALRAIAKTAMGMNTGARGLRTILERLLGDAMFEAPGSSIKYILVTGAVARREEAPLYFARGQQPKFHSVIAAEEEAWEEAKQKGSDDGVSSFEEYRDRAKASGVL